MKWDDLFGRVAGDLVSFVDDLWISGYMEEHAWDIPKQVAPIRFQDAPRKRRYFIWSLTQLLLQPLTYRFKTLHDQLYGKLEVGTIGSSLELCAVYVK